MIQTLIPFLIAADCLGLAVFLIRVLKKRVEKRIEEIGNYIKEGAKAFLAKEFFGILIAGIIIFVIIAIFKLSIAIGFIVGLLTSFLLTYAGMRIATEANYRTTQASLESAEEATKTSMFAGAVAGSLIPLLSACLTLAILLLTRNLDIIVGFGFGSCLSALFAQLGGGIYTKAADVGADLVGKVEKGIPEDDPRNPAVIADLVGDNVGDCAGRAADIFESINYGILTILILSSTIALSNISYLPFLSIFGAILMNIITIGINDWRRPKKGLITAFIIFSILLAGWFFFISSIYKDIKIFYCLTTGLIASIILFFIVNYYSGERSKSVVKTAKAAQWGAAINIMSGFSEGLESYFPAVIPMTIAIILSHHWLDFWGTALMLLGALSASPLIMSADIFGPIVDNADGIAEMAGIKEEKAKETLDILDSMGNMTKALTKGYAICIALLAATLLMLSYIQEAGLRIVNLVEPKAVVGAIIGASVPFIFSGFAIRAVAKTAGKVVEEVRRQFKEIEGLLEGKAKPQYGKCVGIVTSSALKEMGPPVAIGAIIPIIIGLLLGKEALGAYLIGATGAGSGLAFIMFVAGAILDNAKKYIKIGHFGGKGSEAHKASIVGDTFGDPLKDTAGPSLGILIKLQNILALVLASLTL